MGYSNGPLTNWVMHGHVTLPSNGHGHEDGSRNGHLIYGVQKVGKEDDVSLRGQIEVLTEALKD